MPVNYYNKLKPRARELRNKSTLAEVIFWQQIRAKKLGYHFYRQKPLGNYIVDFYCPALKLVLEIDGSSHNEKQKYDKSRDEFLESVGFRVIHFLDKDVKNNPDETIDLLRRIGKIKNPPLKKEVPDLPAKAALAQAGGRRIF